MKFSPEVPPAVSDSQRGGGIEDPYAGWSDERRMSEFAQTGNPDYLTVPLGMAMKIPLDLFRKIPGVTRELVIEYEGTDGSFGQHLEQQNGQISILDLDPKQEFFRENFKRILRDIGWEQLAAQCSDNLEQGIGVLSSGLRFFGDFGYLPDVTLEHVLKQPLDPFTYALFDRVRVFREQLPQTLSHEDPNSLAFLLAEAGIPFRNEVALADTVSKIFAQNPHIRQSAENRQRQYYRDNSVEPPRLDHRTDMEVARELFEAFQLEVIREHVLQYEGDVAHEDWALSKYGQSIMAGVMPAPEALRELFLTSMRTSEYLYREYAQFDENRSYPSFYTASPSVAYYTYPALCQAAEAKYSGNVELQAVYIDNASITALSDSVHVLRGPDGEFIDAVEIFGEKTVGEEQQRVRSLVGLYAQVLRGAEASPSGIAAALFVNWHAFPQELRDEALMYGFRPTTSAGYYEDGRMVDDQINEQGLANLLPDEFCERVVDWIHHSLARAYTVPVQARRFASHTTTHGDSTVENLLKVVTPELVQQIEVIIGVSFERLSGTREVVALLGYLQSIRSADPFAPLRATMIGAETPEDRLNRLKTFLVHTYNPGAVEHLQVFASVTEPETANQFFAEYVRTIEAADRFTKNLQTQSDEPVISDFVSQLESAFLKRAGHLFRAGEYLSLYQYTGDETVSDLVQAYQGVALLQETLADISTGKFTVVRMSERERGDEKVKTFYFKIQNTESTDGALELKVSIRPVADERGEARVNFELYLDALPENDPLRKAFHQRTEFLGAAGKKRRVVERSVIRLGFDLDTQSDPPTFSFDMGRDAYADHTMVRTGDVLGNILTKVAPTGHHLQDFDPMLSDPENFRRVAEAFVAYFDAVPTTTRAVEVR
jgi:hypothetical protein